MSYIKRAEINNWPYGKFPLPQYPITKNDTNKYFSYKSFYGFYCYPTEV